MSDENRFAVKVYKSTSSSPPAELATKAHSISLQADGTLTVIGERQWRVFQPQLWGRIEVEWLQPLPPLPERSATAKDSFRPLSLELHR